MEFDREKSEEIHKALDEAYLVFVKIGYCIIQDIISEEKKFL